MNQIGKWESSSCAVDTETLVQDAVRNVFIGRMLLFGFKIQLNHGPQAHNGSSSCHSTLEFVVNNSISSKKDSRDFSQSANVYQSSSGDTQFFERDRMVAFQTIDPNPDKHIALFWPF